MPVLTAMISSLPETRSVHGDGCPPGISFPQLLKCMVLLLRRLKQGDLKLKASLGCVVSPKPTGFVQ